MARLLCQPCAEKGRRREAENASDVWVYGATPKCGSCIDLPADDGDGGIRDSASERTDAEQRAKGER